MNEKTIRAIEAVLERGERVELWKGKGGEIKVIRVRRETVPTLPQEKAASVKPETACQVHRERL